jgi:hypothetical protein
LVTQPVDRKVSVSQPPANAAALVSETLAFLVAWRRILSGTGPWPATEVDKLREQSRRLQARAKEIGVGGLAHHLKTCDDCLVFEEVDRAELSRRLRNVSELTSQLRQEADPVRTSRPPAASMPPRSQIPAPAPEPAARATQVAAAAPIVVPPIVSVAPQVVPSAPPVAAEPAAPEAPTQPLAAEPSVPPPADEKPEDEKRETLRSDAPRFQIPRPAGSSLPPRPSSRAPTSAPRPRSPVPAAPQTTPPKAPEIATPKAPEVATPKAPPTTLAMAPEPATPLTPAVPVEISAAAAVPAESPAPRPPPQPPAFEPRSSPPQTAATLEPESRARLDTLVGVTENQRTEPHGHVARPPPVYVPPTPPPQPRRDVRPPEQSVFASAGSENAPTLVMRDVEPRRERSSPPGAPPASLFEAPLAPESAPPPSSELDELPWQSSWNRPATRWWLLPMLAGAIAMIAVFWKEIARYVPWLQPGGAPAESAQSGEPIEVEPRPTAADLGERLRELVEQVHAFGRKESPELADLINREASEIGRALGQPCAGPVACQAAERTRELLVARAAPASKTDDEGSRALGAWLAGLALPGIGVRDVPVVQERVEFHTRYTTGREGLQVLLFQCAAHRQTISDSLVQHELPLDLMALPMAESGCLPDTESRLGARGLWQLTPEAAAAYHLEVVPEVMDERVSTGKATEAALRLLADLHAKLGSWELALASYHVGPFELIAQLLRAAPETDFWQLAMRGHFGEPTAAYVGRVQAYAVILANLQHFGFQLPEAVDTGGAAELEVPAGTRLGVVARAAGSSLTRLRELNPELIADTLPDVPAKSYKLLVPSESVRRARQRLPSLIAAADAPDRCVPYSFDWGRQRFTKAMAERCEYVSSRAQ